MFRPKSVMGSKSEVGQSQRHVGLALKSRLELDIAAGQRWADSVEKVASLKSLEICRNTNNIFDCR